MNRRLLVMFLQDVLADARPLQDLQELILEILWDRRGQESQEIVRLAETLDHRIAEFTGGYISFESLKPSLRDAAGLNVSVLKLDDPDADAVHLASSSPTVIRSAALA